MSTPSNNNDNEIAPDMPQMRSVLIRSSGPDGPLTGVYAKQAPILKTAPALKSVSSTTWNPEPLPKLPEMYPLERSHAYVKDVDCAEIASRIAKCLQKESIAATFELNKAFAETSCHTQFYVKLFEDDRQIIVEVQRSTGCAWKFSQCSKAVLCAAKGVKRKSPPAFKVPTFVKAMKQMEDETESALQLAFGLINERRVDAQQLGLESMLQMSRDGIIKSIAQERVEKIIALVNDETHCRDALTTIANLLEAKAMDANTTADDSEFVQLIILKLVDDDLHTSHEAARCLNYICKVVPDIKKRVSMISVAEAQMQGLSRHQKLAEEATLLQTELDQ